MSTPSPTRSLTATSAPQAAAKPTITPRVLGASLEKQSVIGCIFHVEGGSRFVPYSWLLYVEGNEELLILEFTHCTVTVQGAGLKQLLRSFTYNHLAELEVNLSNPKNPHVSSIAIVEKEADALGAD